MVEREIQGWEFKTSRRSALVAAVQRRLERDLTFEPHFQDRNVAFMRMVRRLTDYDANVFKPWEP